MEKLPLNKLRSLVHARFAVLAGVTVPCVVAVGLLFRSGSVTHGRPIHGNGRPKSNPAAEALFESVGVPASQARDAVQKGDYARAEFLFKRALLVGGEIRPFQNPSEINRGDVRGLYDFAKIGVISDLGRLYDKEGKSKEAYETWKSMLRGFPWVSDAERVDPRILAHYGDLCMRFGTVEDARQAYWSAIRAVPQKLAVDRLNIEQSASTDRLAEGAHYASGGFYMATSPDSEAVKEFTKALSYDSRNPVLIRALAYAHYGVGEYAKSKAENFRAEALSEGELREAIHLDRRSMGQIDETSSLNVRTGKVTHYEIKPGHGDVNP